MTDERQKTMSSSPGIHGGYHLFLDGQPVASIVPHYDAKPRDVRRIADRIVYLWNRGRGSSSLVVNPSLGGADRVIDGEIVE